MQIFFITSCNRRAFIIFLLSLNFSIIIHLVSIHFWSMSDTHSYTSWISIFSISLSFASITSFVCSCSDASKTACSRQLTPSVTWCSCLHWSKWFQLIQIEFSFTASVSPTHPPMHGSRIFGLTLISVSDHFLDSCLRDHLYKVQCTLCAGVSTKLMGVSYTSRP